MIWFLLISIGLYTILMLLFSIGFLKLEKFTSLKTVPNTTFSLVIPFRNEAENLSALLQSLSELNYTDRLLEFLFINDASEDTSVAIIQEFIVKRKLSNWILLENERKSISPKKDAITLAVSEAKHDWIFTTDGDCILPKNLLVTLDAFLQKNPSKLIAGPVLALPENNNFLGHYQFLESLTLAGVSMGAFGINTPILCNGAHLAYSKKAFEEVGGFAGNDHIASGDDLFLLEKMQKAFPGKVHFLKNKEQIIYTKTESNWTAVLQQRVRWAAKTSGYKSVLSKFTGVVVLAANVSVIISFVLLFQSGNRLFFMMLILLKWVVDEFFLYQANAFLKRKINWLYLRLMAFLYPVLTTYIAVRALFGTYMWKGRNFKK